MKSNIMLNVRNIRDLKDMITQSAELFLDKNAFLLKKQEDLYEGVTYSQFKNDIDCLGTALLSLGLKDSFIAVLGENRYEWCVTYLSVVNGTGIIVPLDKELPLVELENLLERSNAKAIVYSGKYHSEISKIKPKLKSIEYFINMDFESEEDGILSYCDLIEKGRTLINQGDRSFVDSEIDVEKMSILLFTSGTTDLAKGVMLSHKNISSNIMAVRKLVYIDEKDSIVSILPLHHTYECTCGFLIMMYTGSCISFNEGLKHIAKNLKEVKPTIMISVPLILEGMYRKIWEGAAKKGKAKKLAIAVKVSSFLYYKLHIDIRKKLFSKVLVNIGGRLRLIISGAASIDPAVSKGLRALGVDVLQGYGLTECSPIATANTLENYKDDALGMAIPGVEMKIDNPDKDGIGEILVKGDNVMLGYFENPITTEKVLKDGWLYTGDLGKVDKDGFYKITGRKKNVIVTKNGKNIFPEEVESYINKSPYVLESLVWGKDDIQTSDDTFVCAQIVPYLEAIQEKLQKEDVTSDEIYKIINEEIKATNKNMPLYKKIRKFEVRETEFIKTTTKKIKRYAEKV